MLYISVPVINSYFHRLSGESGCGGGHDEVKTSKYRKKMDNLGCLLLFEGNPMCKKVIFSGDKQVESGANKSEHFLLLMIATR